MRFGCAVVFTVKFALLIVTFRTAVNIRLTFKVVCVGVDFQFHLLCFVTICAFDNIFALGTACCGFATTFHFGTVFKVVSLCRDRQVGCFYVVVAVLDKLFTAGALVVIFCTCRCASCGRTRVHFAIVVYVTHGDFCFRCKRIGVFRRNITNLDGMFAFGQRFLVVRFAVKGQRDIAGGNILLRFVGVADGNLEFAYVKRSPFLQCTELTDVQRYARCLCLFFHCTSDNCTNAQHHDKRE